MSLKPLRQTEQVNVDFMCPWTQERGGCLTIGSASGMVFAQYAFDPTNTKALGIQLNDVEWMNLMLHPHRQYRDGKMTEVPCGIVGVGTQGDFITDWIYLIGSVENGDHAYIGPSGTFTNFAGLGTEKIGKFIGPLQVEPHFVIMRGMGFSRTYIDTCTKALVTENDPNDRTLVHSPGFIKIRVDAGSNLR